MVTRIDGKRAFTSYAADYLFYTDDPNGKYTTIYQTPVTRFITHSSKEFRKELSINSGKKLWESDINPVFRCLADNYRHAGDPELHIGFLDIETDFDSERGYSSPDDPFTAITAITLHLNWTDQLVTFALPPKGLSWEEASEIAGKFSDTFLFKSEAEMLKEFLNLIEDVDVLSGWNSEGFDIPYLVNRIARVLSKDDTRRLCLWDQFPKKRTFERFGSENNTFDLVGRVHIDYMALYRKFTYEERHSYALNAIGEYELKENKIQYEGTLDQLYNQDFYKFLDYNRQDVLLLCKLDAKLKFIELINAYAHDACVQFQTAFGTVSITDQAAVNFAHDLGLIVPSKKHKIDDGIAAAGAYVAYPKKGMHEWIGIVDINSLYPSTIRALNMSPETIIGQIRPIMTNKAIADLMSKKETFAGAWEGEFGTKEYQAVMRMDKNINITIDWEGSSGNNDTMSAADVWELIFNSNQKWALSANGTIFTYEREGIIPGLLNLWYKDRLELQQKKKEATTKEEKAYYDKKQYVRKIALNATYGALLNPGSRFNDFRIGQSTTLSGRVITKHMCAFINECITGEYNHVGDSAGYSDTDSFQFSAWPIMKPLVEAGEATWSAEECIALYDELASKVNTSFPEFMEKSFHIPMERGAIIKCGREVVARRGIFITKKRYAMLMIDKDGTRLDMGGSPGKVKAMGLDLKRADTPKIVQDFLSDILLDLLCGHDISVIIAKINDFKIVFNALPAWEKGTPKRVNNLSNFAAREKALGKANLPGHVRAALNWNNLRKIYSDKHSIQIVDGMKVVVCKLRQNPVGYASVAYPTDSHNLPEWFTSLPFDESLMATTIVDKKIENLFSELAEWKEIENQTQARFDSFNSLFSFD